MHRHLKGITRVLLPPLIAAALSEAVLHLEDPQRLAILPQQGQHTLPVHTPEQPPRILIIPTVTIMTTTTSTGNFPAIQPA